VPLSLHAEIDRRGALAPRDPRRYADYLRSRPREWEQDAIELAIRLCGEYRCPTHIVHLSSADAVPALEQARKDGLPLTVETCPHYLYFAAEDIPDGGTAYKCAPPIRERENNERLWAALRAGVIDMVVSDHSPCPPEMRKLKEGDFFKAWGGIASLQLGLPVMWTAASARGFGPADLARWMCEGPARLAGLERTKGRIAAGFDADFVVWNPEARGRVEPSRLYHRHKVTPYAGCALQGVVERVYLRGLKVSENGVVFAEPNGKMLRRAV
jgi:allantoinase